jgi:hypothetical protein
MEIVLKIIFCAKVIVFLKNRLTEFEL